MTTNVRGGLIPSVGGLTLLHPATSLLLEAIAKDDGAG